MDRPISAPLHGETTSCAAELGRRVFDAAAAGVLLLAALPILAAAAIGVRAFLGRPVLFRQIRPGRHGQPFTIYKFRSMREASGPDGRPLPDHERLTRFGRFLRATSIDELPNLWNVLTGHMSLVGPRPLLMQYLPHYTERERLRLLVRPGMTGWAQVNGRNEVPWDVRLEQDAWYVENRSLALDLHILALTVLAVFSRRGATTDVQATFGTLDEERTGRAPLPSAHPGGQRGRF